LKKLGVEVVGVSGDAVINLRHFKDANNLNFPLLSDVTGEISKKFAVPISKGGSIKKLIGGNEKILERGLTTSRWTFIVNKAGNIVYKNTKVKVANDSEEVIYFIKSLNN
jgi:thioredoxin-dependent peroxiredoxin